jgi:hypothetical protein
VRQADGVIEVSRLKDLNAADQFLGFRIGPVGRRDFAVFPAQGHGGLRRLKRYFGNQVSVDAQMVIVLKAFVEHCVSLVLGHPFEFSWLDVSQNRCISFFFSSWCEPAAQPCPLDRSSYGRRTQEKSTAEANYFLFRHVVRNDQACHQKQLRVEKDIDVSRSDPPDNFRLARGRRLDKAVSAKGHATSLKENQHEQS